MQLDHSGGIERRNAWIEIDLDALRHNAAALRSLIVNGAALWPVLKANAYGHGSLAVAHGLAEYADVVCVATLDEAIELRDGGLSTRILCLYEPPHAAWQLAMDYQIELGITSVEGLRRIRSVPGRCPVHVKIDTGLSRQGIVPRDLDRHWADLVGLGERLGGLWTHLADGADVDRSAEQLQLFDAVSEDLASEGLRPQRHVAASAAILSGIGLEYDAVRPGLALYGLIPTECLAKGPTVSLPLRPVMSVRARPVRLTTIPAGTSVGYGGAYTTNRRTLLATLPLGYADGIFRSLGMGASCVLVKGLKAPIVGHVSMDAIGVDVTGIAGVAVNSVFTILGSDGENVISGNDMAAAAGTIPHEIGLRFAQRLPHRYGDRRHSREFNLG